MRPLAALIFDLDGTAIPNQPNGYPSQRVIAAVKQAQTKLQVSVATGRPVTNCRHLLDAFSIRTPSIFAGGTQIYDPVRQTVLWEKTLPQATVMTIIEQLHSYPYEIYVSDEVAALPARQIKVTRDERVLYIMAVSAQDTQVIMSELAKIPEIAVHEVMSWTKGHFDIHITHEKATKQNALTQLLQLLKVSPEEVLAVGDSNNDLPLFASAGTRVAMGNGSEALKKAADYVVPTVEENGLAVAIEKFIL